MSKGKGSDFHDETPAFTLTKEQRDHLAGEINRLDSEINQYLRITSGPMQLALTVIATIIGAANKGSIELSSFNITLTIRDIVLFTSPILLSIIALYNVNVSTQVAVMAEIRDRLSYRLNKALGNPIYVQRVAGNLRRNSRGTILAYGLSSIVVLIIMALGFLNVMQREKILLDIQLVITILCLVSLAIALLELFTSRKEINTLLDKIYGPDDRPGKKQDISIK